MIERCRASEGKYEVVRWWSEKRCKQVWKGIIRPDGLGGVYDARDAVFAAAAKLAADGIRRDPRAAIFAYNHSLSYVSEVLAWATRYGWGRGAPLPSAVLSDPNIELRPEARVDVLSGRVDPRVLAALLVLSQSFRLADVGPLVTGHSTFVAGTDRVSDHASGRAVDIAVIDGVAVSADNTSARRAVRFLLELPPPLRPDELGSPWPLSSPVVTTFTQGHHDHIHIGYGALP